MDTKNVATNDLRECKAMAKINRAKLTHNKSFYLVYGTTEPNDILYRCSTMEEVEEFLDERVARDNYLYEKFDDYSVFEDYCVCKIDSEKVVAYLEHINN